MSKDEKHRQAYLVEFSLLTRIIVDNPNDVDIETSSPDAESMQLENKIIQAAAEKIRQFAIEDPYYPQHDDVARVELDTEVPFDPKSDV